MGRITKEDRIFIKVLRQEKQWVGCSPGNEGIFIEDVDCGQSQQTTTENRQFWYRGEKTG